jgi:disease resistance protein RPM1
VTDILNLQAKKYSLLLYLQDQRTVQGKVEAIKAMAGIVVSASKGVIGTLLDKLTSTPNYVVFLRDELQTMNALLEKLDDMEELDPLVKAWRDQVRETAYDIEDCIDDCSHRVRSGDANSCFFNKVYHFVKTLRARPETTKHIKELKIRLKEVNERCKRYKFGNYVPSPSYVPADRRLPALYSDTSNLVGIEGPREEVIKLLLDADQQLKVLSIVGFGGLGNRFFTVHNTTLYYRLKRTYM